MIEYWKFEYANQFGFEETEIDEEELKSDSDSEEDCEFDYMVEKLG